MVSGSVWGRLPLALRANSARASTTARPRCHLLFIAFAPTHAVKTHTNPDFGYNDIGYHQNAASSANPQGLPTTNAAAGILPTPHLDRLAKEGVKLENYYVQPLYVLPHVQTRVLTCPLIFLGS